MHTRCICVDDDTLDATGDGPAHIFVSSLSGGFPLAPFFSLMLPPGALHAPPPPPLPLPLPVSVCAPPPPLPAPSPQPPPPLLPSIILPPRSAKRARSIIAAPPPPPPPPQSQIRADVRPSGDIGTNPH